MSHKNNEEFLENAKLNFDEAVEKGDYATCKLIIKDVADISPKEAEILEGLLKAVPLSSFVTKTPYEY